MTDRLAPSEMPGWIESQLPFRRYRLEVGDGLAAHVMEQGEGRPVLMFHGNPTWGYLYRRVAADLVGEPFRLIMPDLIGLGFSDFPASRDHHTLANHARWMGALVGALGLDEAIAVVQDWGGPIGLLAMAAHPGLMSGMVVMNTTIGAPKPGFKPTLFHRVFSTWLGEVGSRVFAYAPKTISFAQGDRSSIGGVVARSYGYPLRRRRGHETMVELVKMVPDDMDHPSIPLLGEAGEFAMGFSGPSAIVWGDRDPVLGRLRRRVTRQLPHAEVTVTEAGHFLQEEVPGQIADAVRAVAGV